MPEESFDNQAPAAGRILIVDYDPRESGTRWARKALRVEHTGSTSVPAWPADSADQEDSHTGAGLVRASGVQGARHGH